MAVNKLSINEFDEKVVASDKLVILDFFRNGCGPCQALAPVLEEIDATRDDVEIFSVNIEDEPDLAVKLRVMAAPTLLFLKEGSVKKKTLGFKSKESLDEIINSLK